MDKENAAEVEEALMALYAVPVHWAGMGGTSGTFKHRKEAKQKKLLLGDIFNGVSLDESFNKGEML
ncbi:MAG: hypothetical protein AABY87_00930 [bacterium]